VVFIFINEDVPGGLELLAVAAPGREELDEDLCGDGVLRAGRAALGSNHLMTLNCHAAFAEALYGDAGASRADVLQAVAILEDVARARRRVLGEHHPDTALALASLERARMRREDVAA